MAPSPQLAKPDWSPPSPRAARGAPTPLAVSDRRSRTSPRVRPRTLPNRTVALPESTDIPTIELVRRAQAGDRAAFSQIIRREQQRVFACAMKVLRNKADAEDATQETFVRAYRAIESFDGRSELSTWLYRICVNLSLNKIRSRKKHVASDIDDPTRGEPESDAHGQSGNPEIGFAQAEFAQRLALAVSSLSPSLRTTVELVLVEGVGQREAAEVLGCTEGTVAWRVHEARKKLREMLVDVLDAVPTRQVSATKIAASDTTSANTPEFAQRLESNNTRIP